MPGAPPPADEAERLRAVASYGLLESMQDAALDAIVRVACTVCETPVSLISVVEAERQWFLSSYGLPGVTGTPREQAFCAHTILSPDVTVVEDATQDPRFATNALVQGEPHIRFYAGVPLIDKQGFALGSLCVIDRTPRTLSPSQIAVLRELSTAVVQLLEARRVDNALFAAETAAKRARADLDTVLNAAAACIASWDATLVIRFANEAFAEWFGVPRETLPGRGFASVVGEALFELARPHLEATLRGETRRFEHDIPARPGTTSHSEITLVPDVQDGVVVGFVSTSADVTAFRTALATSEQRNDLLTLAEELGDIGHWRVDVGQELVFWSPQVYRIHGREPVTFAPTLTNGIEAYHRDDRARVTELLQRAIANREPFGYELRIVRPDGTLRQVEVRARCEVDPATQRTRAIFGVFQDVTERALARDREARQDRLVTTGTLAAGVGHEINNPLTYVTANIDFALAALRELQGAPAPAVKQELLQTLEEAQEGGERIRKIVRGLRLFAREDAPVAPTDLRTAIELAANMAVAELRNCATLVMELLPVPAALADETRLSQVLVNLLVNAAQSFDERNPEQNRITLRTGVLPGARVAIDVEDNGRGIPGDVLPRIFDPFFTTKDVGQGSGLGLAICHAIVASFGGELSCTTRVGAGTTFRIALPAAAAAPVSEATTAPSDLPAVVRGRVLVVDDEPSVLRTIERSLRSENDVTTLGDPREALRLLLAEGSSFDVVFCDLMMPYLSGTELYAQVAAHDPALASRFVFITGGVTDESVRAFLASITNRCCDKPFDGRLLRDAARELVRRRHPT